MAIILPSNAEQPLRYSYGSQRRLHSPRRIHSFLIIIVSLVEGLIVLLGSNRLLIDRAPRLVSKVLLPIVYFMVVIDDISLNLWTSRPVLASHSLTVRSADVEASSEPSGEKATARTQLVCPSSFCTSRPVLASHSLTVSSFDVEASSEPSGEKATAFTERVYPSSFYTSRPVLASYSLTVRSANIEASSEPSGEKATAFT